MKALSDPTRRAILDGLLARDGQTLFELCGRLVTNHELTSSRQAVSQHLDVLEAAGLVRTKREGRYKLHYADIAPLESIVGRWLGGRADRHSDRDAGTGREKTGMRISWASVLVDDQERALRFYTGVLGFVAKHDVSIGEDRWLTVVSPQDPDGTELVLEPSSHPAVGPFKEALVADGIPFTSFAVDDVDAEYQRLRRLGVHFTQSPTAMGQTTTAVFDDTCGNLIQIHHRAEHAT